MEHVELWSKLREWGWRGECDFNLHADHNVWNWALSNAHSHFHTKAFELLLTHAPRPRLIRQEIPLLLRASFFNTSMLPMLIEAGEDINERDKAGNSILLLGLNRNESHAGLEELMAFNPDLSPNQFNETPLLFAGRQTHFSLFKTILERSFDDLINLPDVDGRTPLSEAYTDDLRECRLSKMKSLLERGANPNVFVPRFHSTLLHHALRTQVDDVVELLVEFNVSPWMMESNHHPAKPLSHQLGLLRRIERERVDYPVWNPAYEERTQTINTLLKNWIIEGDRRLLNESLPDVSHAKAVIRI